METSPLREDEIEPFVDELWLPARREMATMRKYTIADDIRRKGVTHHRSRLSDDDFITSLARRERQFLGYVTAEVRTPPSFFRPVRECHVTEIFVRKDARRRGIAAELLETIEEWGRAKDCEYLDLYVDRENTAAKTLYEEQGYAVERYTMKRRLEGETSDGSNRGTIR